MWVLIIWVSLGAYGAQNVVIQNLKDKAACESLGERIIQESPRKVPANIQCIEVK